MKSTRTFLLPLASLALACGGDDSRSSSDGGASATNNGATSAAATGASGTSTTTGASTTTGVGGEGTGGGGEGGSGPITHFHGNYSSPTIVRIGSTYHAWFAAQKIGGQHYNIPHATFTANGNWHFVGEALPNLGQDAFVGPGAYPVWAPAVGKIGDGEWMLYYTAQLQDHGEKKCIWRAHATDANGPFVDDYAGGPIVCSDSGLWSIDPYLVEDAQNVWHLGARIDQAGGINTIQVRALGPHGAGFAEGSSWFELTHNAPSSWEQPVLENAGIVRLTPPTGPAHWFVFYSGRAWADDSYAVGYSDCGEGINGPCTKKTPNGPWLHTIAAQDLYGPGTPTFYTDEAGQMLMSVQAWEHSGGTSNANNKGQIMRTYAITVDDDYVPSVNLLRVDLQ